MLYDAFISYSHGADARLAPALQTALHRFAKPWWKLRAVNVFRDGTSLAAAHDLSGAIKTALAQSQFFIFLASPRAAQSKWCQREVEYWLAERPLDALLIVLTEGTITWDEAAGDFDWTVTDALPRALAGAFKAEPLWLDLSWARTGDQVSTGDPRFHQGVAMLAARLHGKSLDQIAGEDVRAHRRTRLVTRAAVATLALLTVSSVIGAWYAVEGQRRAERSLEQALAATDTLVGDVANGMRNFYGVPRDKLAAMLGRVEVILNTLAAMETSDAIVERRVEMMVTLSGAYIDLGNLPRADELARKAEGLITPLAQRDGPASAPWRRLTFLQGELFDIARRRSDYAEVEARSLRYRELVEAAAKALTDKTEGPVRYRVLRGVVLALQRQTTAAQDQGRLDEALALARESVAAADALLAAFPNDATARYHTATERSQVANILSDLGRLDEAMADLDAARAALRKVEEANPNQLDVLRALVEIDSSRATIFQTRDDWIAAVALYENNARVLGQLRSADPKNIVLTSRLASMLRDLAFTSVRVPDLARAREAYAQSATLFAEALQISPDSISAVESATRGLLLEATFLEQQGDRAGAIARLDRAAEIGDALVLQRGADAAGVLLGVSVRAARARLRNLEGQPKAAAADLERAEHLLGVLGRPVAPADLQRAVGAVVDIARQWGFAARLDRSLATVTAALELYTPPPGLSAAATVAHRISMAKLMLQKATVELDRGDASAAMATAEEAVRQYETEIVPHTRSDRLLDDFAQQLTLVGRIAVVGRQGDRARAAYCAVSPKIAALAPNLHERPRVRLTVLDSEFLCAEARYFGGEHDESERAMAALAKRVDDAVPVQGGLMSDWRSLRARVARLRAGMRVIAGDAKGAVPLLREAIRYHQDAVSIPAPSGDDLAGLAFVQGQLADVLDEEGDKDGARSQAESAVATLRKAARIDRIDYTLEIKLADAMVNLGELWRKDEPAKALGHFNAAASLMATLAQQVPQQGRHLVLEARSRALHQAGDAAYSLERTGEAIARHRAALAAATELAALRPDDVEVKLDLARQHGRLARALEQGKHYADARAESAEARRLFVTHRAAARNPAAIDRHIGWVDKLVATIAEGESKAQPAASAPPQ